MGTRERYEPGTFCWVELATSDEDAAKEFYGSLLGWSYDDRSIGEDAVYSMAKLDDHHVAAIFKSDQPPHWNSYVTVDDVEAAARKADEAGGTVAAEPFDVMEAGRMAVVEDPTGATLCLWEARDHIGATLVNAPGALSWNDLATSDVGKAAEFYGELFGWEVAEVEGAPGDRVVIRNGETMNGGMAALPESAQDAPAHWLPYFAVQDVDRAVEVAVEAGGQALADAMDVPAGRFALLADPHGAVFAIFSGDLDD